MLSLTPGLGTVAWRLTSARRGLAHEGPPAHPASPGRHDREAVWPRWRASGDRGAFSAQAAADRRASLRGGASHEAKGRRGARDSGTGRVLVPIEITVLAWGLNRATRRGYRPRPRDRSTGSRRATAATNREAAAHRPVRGRSSVVSWLRRRTPAGPTPATISWQIPRDRIGDIRRPGSLFVELFLRKQNQLELNLFPLL